jgi:hypothetical protein
MNPLGIAAVLKTRTAQAAIAAVAAHAAAALSPKLGFPVEASDIANAIGALLDLAAIYFRAQAPVRDQQDVATPKPQD